MKEDAAYVVKSCHGIILMMYVEIVERLYRKIKRTKINLLLGVEEEGIGFQRGEEYEEAFHRLQIKQGFKFLF